MACASAAKFVATTIKEILCDTAVYQVKAVTIVEIMGRDAGWLTAAAALPRLSGGRAPDLIYLPERPFDTEAFLSHVKAALATHPNVVVAISEGIRTRDGEYISAGALDAFGHQQLSGAGKTLENLVRHTLGCKARSVELNLPQRCSAHLASATDIRESVAIGKAAVRFATEGKSAVMIALRRLCSEPYTTEICAVPVSEVANMVKGVPEEYITAEGNGITDAALAYLAPLILGEVSPKFEAGMPKHFVF